MKYRYETFESDSRYFLLAEDFLSALRLKGYAVLPFKGKKGNLEVIGIPFSLQGEISISFSELQIDFCDLASGRTKIRARIEDSDKGRETWDFVMPILNPILTSDSKTSKKPDFVWEQLRRAGASAKQVELARYYFKTLQNEKELIASTKYKHPYKVIADLRKSFKDKVEIPKGKQGRREEVEKYREYFKVKERSEKS